MALALSAHTTRVQLSVCVVSACWRSELCTSCDNFKPWLEAQQCCRQSGHACVIVADHDIFAELRTIPAGLLSPWPLFELAEDSQHKLSHIDLNSVWLLREGLPAAAATQPCGDARPRLSGRPSRPETTD